MMYISIGSNLGNRLTNIQHALTLLKNGGVKIVRCSPIIETAAQLLEGAPASWDLPFFNMVIAVSTDQPPEDVLAQLQLIEQKLGRASPHPKWAPRIIDLDILFIDNQIINRCELTVPHPGLIHRPFLIHLLALLAPEKIHPVLQKTMLQLAYEVDTLPNCFIRSLVIAPQLVGVVNITPDSFSDGGQFLAPEDAVRQALHLHEMGASVIELGPQSTRPKVSTNTAAVMTSAKEEYKRLHPVLTALDPIIAEKKLRIGIDCFYPETILKILHHHEIAWIDIKGSVDDACLAEIAQQDCQFVAMHSLSIPHRNDTVMDLAQPPIQIICAWAEQKIAHLLRCGFREENIILDPGIGYGKTLYQDIYLLRDMAQLKALGYPILIGHSRKKFIGCFSQKPAAERDVETIALAGYLKDLEIDYIRVHNIEDHMRAFVATVAA